MRYKLYRKKERGQFEAILETMATMLPFLIMAFTIPSQIRLYMATYLEGTIGQIGGVLGYANDMLGMLGGTLSMRADRSELTSSGLTLTLENAADISDGTSLNPTGSYSSMSFGYNAGWFGMIQIAIFYGGYVQFCDRTMQWDCLPTDSHKKRSNSIFNTYAWVTVVDITTGETVLYKYPVLVNDYIPAYFAVKDENVRKVYIPASAFITPPRKNHRYRVIVDSTYLSFLRINIPIRVSVVGATVNTNIAGTLLDRLSYNIDWCEMEVWR